MMILIYFVFVLFYNQVLGNSLCMCGGGLIVEFFFVYWYGEVLLSLFNMILFILVLYEYIMVELDFWRKFMDYFC